jgi:hypothetical protein
MATIERIVATPRGDAVLSKSEGGTWSLRGRDFGSVTPPGGTAREAFKAAFGVFEGTRLAAGQEGPRGRA